MNDRAADRKKLHRNDTIHEPLPVRPIGIIRTPYTEKYHAPRQPGAEGESITGTITLDAHCNYEQALADLTGFDRIWIISWFDRNTNWRPKVLPPRSGRTRRGMFATRSPHRPNPIGISVCKLLGVRGREIVVENPDLLDGTPILDIKPYIPYADSFPDSAIGWLGEFEQAVQQPYTVKLSRLAKGQIAWLEQEYGVHFMDRISLTLSRDPFPHSSRRIKEDAAGGYVMGVKSWRVFFTVKSDIVSISRIESGYPTEVLNTKTKRAVRLHNEEAHHAFHLKYR